MRTKVRINPKTHLVCVPKDMVDEGMVGSVDSYANAVTLTLVSPNAKLEDVKASLETVLHDIDLRIRLDERGKQTKPETELPPQVKGGNEFDNLRRKLKGGNR
jgi:hypothetical protein